MHPNLCTRRHAQSRGDSRKERKECARNELLQEGLRRRGWKDGRNEGTQKGRHYRKDVRGEGGKEDWKDGREDGRKEGMKDATLEVRKKGRKEGQKQRQNKVRKEGRADGL